MFADTLRFLIENVSDFFALALLSRFYLQVVRAPFQHPLPQFLLGLTNWIVLPARRFMKSVAGYDSATLVLAWITLFMKDTLIIAVSGAPLNFVLPVLWLTIALMALVHLVKMSVYILFAAVILQAILSFVSPYNPLTPILDRLTAPFLRPLRQVISPIGGIDLTPMVLFLILQVVLMLPIAWIEQQLFSMLLSSL